MSSKSIEEAVVTWLRGLRGRSEFADLDSADQGDGGRRSGKGVGGRLRAIGLDRSSSAYLKPMKKTVHIRHAHITMYNTVDCHEPNGLLRKVDTVEDAMMIVV